MITHRNAAINTIGTLLHLPIGVGERLLCAAPTVLISLANAPADVRGQVPAGLRVVTAGAPPAAATIERLEGKFDWEVTHVYGLTETAPFITVCAPLPEHGGLHPPTARS
jgi:fatty-acyl-CoA synthase